MRQIILARHRGGRERDGAAHLLRKALERRGGVLAHLQDLLGVAVEELARVGGVGLLRRAHDELDAELTLERGDVGGDGRLRQVQQLGRAGKAAVFDHIDERLQLLDIHINVHSPAPLRASVNKVTAYSISVSRLFVQFFFPQICPCAHTPMWYTERKRSTAQGGRHGQDLCPHPHGRRAAE